MAPAPASRAAAGPPPAVSANGLSGGIVWDIDRGTNQLRTYSTDSYATEPYNSDQAANGRDALGAAVKFQVATPVNGRVYVGSGTGDPNNFLVVYGPITPPNAPRPTPRPCRPSRSVDAGGEGARAAEAPAPPQSLLPAPHPTADPRGVVAAPEKTKFRRPASFSLSPPAAAPAFIGQRRTQVSDRNRKPE